MNIDALIKWLKTAPALPWEQEGRPLLPYYIWLLEVMLQQTTTAAVAGRFETWIKRFPDITHVAAADEEEILREWEGLGYYSRARNLYKTAKIISKTGWLCDYQFLKKLPGVGNYTAKALMARIFDAPVLAVDANVRRIFMRYNALLNNDLEDERQWETTLLPCFHKYGGFRVNHALMRLGQLICRSKKPLCLLCPLSGSCAARKQALQEQIPPVKKQTNTLLSSVVVLFYDRDTDSFLIEQRSNGEIGRGLYALPRFSNEALIHLRKLYGEPRQTLPPLTHSYTTYREKLYPYLFLADSCTYRSESDREFFAARGSMDSYAFLSVYRKIINGFLNSSFFK
jgi:A/G-specific adenine glycosylase